MKFSFGFILFAALLAMTLAIPSGYYEPLTDQEESLNPVETFAEEPSVPEEHGVRFSRATCDLLSFSTPWGSAGHSICAAHCISMNRGFRGGRCIDGVCNCRR